MSDLIFDTFFEKYSKLGKVLNFHFQGGEPTLAGLDFFERVLKIQNKSNNTCNNSIQTNGLILNNDWLEFLNKNRFLVGISIDGPQEVHDKKRGKETCKTVIKSIKMMLENNICLNALVCVSDSNVKFGKEVYNFIKETGIQYIQFIPITNNISSIEWGNFLISIFNEWIKDIGNVFIQNIEEYLWCWMDNPANVCIYANKCGCNLVIEANGDIFSCDHFVDDKHKLGNIMIDDIQCFIDCDIQKTFSNSKFNSNCINCKYIKICNGGCPKDRFNGHNKLCDGYKIFFKYIEPFLNSAKQALNTI